MDDFPKRSVIVANGQIDPNKEIENTIFKFGICEWEPHFNQRGTMAIRGPLCTRCHVQLTSGNSTAMDATCINCGQKYAFPSGGPETLKQQAHLVYEGYLRQCKTIISLNIPISNVFDEEKDEFHAVKVYLSQKEGKKTALVYIIERDGSGNKSHIFLDLENEGVRYDAGDIPPGKILSKMKVEFQKSKHEIEYIKEDSA